MKRLSLVSCLLALSFWASSASSTVITTTFSSNNGQSGNMFDVVNLVDALTVTGFDLNLDSGSWDIEIYEKSGSWVGFSNDSAAWTLVDTGTVASSGIDSATFFDVSDFVLGGSATTALYITVANGTAINYTNGSAVGSVFADNGELQILEGAGVAYAFGATFSPRVWNGSIHYETASPVPEPAAIALLGIGLAGIGWSRKGKKA